MKEEGDVFKKFRDSFSRMEGHFHILEQRVPVELQMEYFKYSENVRKENRPPRPLSEDECETLYNTLLTEETTDKTEKRYLLSQLATSKSVRAYRLLEEYTQHPTNGMGLKSAYTGDDLGNINQAMTFYGGVNWYATTAVKTSLGYEFGYYDQGDAVVERVYGNTVWAQVQVLF